MCCFCSLARSPRTDSGIVCRVARPAHDTTSIIHQAVLSKEMHPPADFSHAIFSLPSSSLIPPPLPPSLALCAGALRASCHCLSLVLTYEFIKRVSAARAGGFWRGAASQNGWRLLALHFRPRSVRTSCSETTGWTCLPFPVTLAAPLCNLLGKCLRFHETAF